MTVGFSLLGVSAGLSLLGVSVVLSLARTLPSDGTSRLLDVFGESLGSGLNIL